MLRPPPRPRPRGQNPMSATKRERVQHEEPHGTAESPHRPYWKRMHRSWFFWVAAVAMLAAMVIYVMSIGLVFRPRGQAQPALPEANTP
jgi:anti-sigma-K factor RskA